MPRIAVVIILAALGAVASGCSMATRALEPIERPTLDVPPVPPRVIDPAPLPEVTFIEPVPDLPAPPVDAKPIRKSPREAGNSRDTQKPDSKPEIPPVPDPAAPAPAQNTQPAPVLRTPATADTAAAERRIRDMVERAQNVLGNIDYQKLTEQRKGAYDQAKNSIEATEAALKESNFELATEMAEKADKLARELQARNP
ncbi:MAG: hypothetical protein ACRD15_18850 [Vicinamibacterales bacterium]